jgi:hypothetical protein
MPLLSNVQPTDWTGRPVKVTAGVAAGPYINVRPPHMFTYTNGSPIEVGDSVLFEHGRTPGTVELVVVTPDGMKAIGVAGRGVMLLSPPFGRAYLPEWSLRDDPLVFVSRGRSA